MKQIILFAVGIVLTTALFAAPPLPSRQPIAPSCVQSLGAAVPDANTARKIADAVISARQKPEQLRGYRLNVEPDGDNPGSWRVWQSPLGQAITGGGGISLRINRCTAAVSDFHYQR